MASSPTVVEHLNPLIGTWRMEVVRALDPSVAFQGQVAYELMPGGHFLVQRWEVDDTDAPDGVAIIGYDPDRDTLVQHCFDSHGAALVYEVSLDEGALRMWRRSAGFSERFTGRLGERGKTIQGGWEKSDDGVRWETEFHLTCTKLT